jgi:hypothetical protein
MIPDDPYVITGAQKPLLPAQAYVFWSREGQATAF